MKQTEKYRTPQKTHTNIIFHKEQNIMKNLPVLTLSRNKTEIHAHPGEKKRGKKDLCETTKQQAGWHDRRGDNQRMVHYRITTTLIFHGNLKLERAFKNIRGEGK